MEKKGNILVYVFTTGTTTTTTTVVRQGGQQQWPEQGHDHQVPQPWDVTTTTMAGCPPQQQGSTGVGGHHHHHLNGRRSVGAPPLQVQGQYGSRGAPPLLQRHPSHYRHLFATVAKPWPPSVLPPSPPQTSPLQTWTTPSLWGGFILHLFIVYAIPACIVDSWNNNNFIM